MKKISIKRLSVLGVMVALLATSCSKNSSTGNPTEASETNSSPSAGGEQIATNGAGSTFDSPALQKWFEAYASVDSNVKFNYQPIGSGGGQKQLLNQTVDFGASDAPMSDDSLAKAPGKILHLPIVVGGVAIIYNLPGNPKLKLDGDVLAGIYMGMINKWNDP